LIITATGWTWDTVDSLTLPQAEELTDYWAESPPVHILARAFMEYEGKGSKKGPARNEPDESELRALAAQFNR
jgi:hypothetical protein